MQVAVEHGSAATVVAVTGEVDLATATDLSAHLDGVDTSRVVVVDLSGVSFIDSSGLNVLVQLRQKLLSATHTDTLILVITRPSTKRIFEVTGLSDVFNIFDSVAGALASL